MSPISVLLKKNKKAAHSLLQCNLNVRDPLTLGKVHFKRPKPLAPGEKIKRPGSTVIKCHL